MAASRIRARISQPEVNVALNTPGGPLHRAIRRTVVRAKEVAIGNAPVGNQGDYMHRVFFPSWAKGPKAPGTYKASFSTDIRGSRGPVVIGNLRNSAEHAAVIEEGRTRRGGKQVFASASRPARPLGSSAFEEQRAVAQALVSVYGTSTREGLHIMEDALAVAAAAVLGVRAGRKVAAGQTIPSGQIRGGALRDV